MAHLAADSYGINDYISRIEQTASLGNRTVATAVAHAVFPKPIIFLYM